MTNNFVPLPLPYASTKDFEIGYDIVTNSLSPDGVGLCYGLRNKITGVIEMRGMTLSICVVAMQNQQQLFDNMLSGKMNGFVEEDTSKVSLPEEGDVL